MTHRLSHKTPHRRHALLQNRSVVQLKSIARRKSRPQFRPNLVVRPLIDIFVMRTLQIQSRNLRRPHAEQREPALVVAINQFIRSRRYLRQNSEPAKRIFTLVNFQRRSRQRRPADSMKAVATRNEIALERLRHTAALKLNLRLRDCAARVTIVNADRLGLENNLPAGRNPRRDEILDHLVLRVNRDRLPGQLREINPMPRYSESQLNAIVNKSFALQPRTDSGLHHQLDRAVLQHASANPALAICARLAFEHDRLDALQMQQVRQHQACRSSADNSNLRSHSRNPARCYYSRSLAIAASN